MPFVQSAEWVKQDSMYKELLGLELRVTKNMELRVQQPVRAFQFSMVAEL